MKRVVVVGPPGSGKTTTGRAIADRLGILHVELDSIWWEENWTEAGPEVFQQRAAAAVAGDTWVVDGNYVSSGARAVIWPRADTVVWLDLPRRLTVPRVVWRSTVRVVRREELWAGNRETLGVLRPDSIIRFAWDSHAKYKRYEHIALDPELGHLAWVRLRSPREVRQWLSSLPVAAP